MSKTGPKALFLASNKAFDEYSDIVKMLLKKGGFDINNAITYNGIKKTALIAASGHGHSEITRFLLDEKDIDINRVDTKRRTALYVASQNSHSDVAQMLLREDRVVINTADNDGKTALYWASVNGLVEVVKLLLQKPEVKINTDYEGMTALWIAFEKDHTEIVQLLLEHPRTNITKGIPDDDERNIKISNLMFVQGITNMTDMDPARAILVDALLGNATQVSFLLDMNIKHVNTNDSLNRAPLFWASSRGHIEVVELLLAKPGILVNNKRSINEATALYQASKFGHLKVVEILVAHPSVGVNYHTLEQITPLMIASTFGHYKVVGRLLSVVDIEVNLATFNGKTALIYAVASNQYDTIELLLRCPQTDSTLIDEEYKTAFDWAQGKNDNKSVLLFSSRGMLQITKGHTCCSKAINRGLHRAVKREDFTWIETFLICPGIDINVNNNDGYTPLNLATEIGITRMVEIFLKDLRIDVNKPNTGRKQHVLQIASGRGHADIVRLLLLHPQTFVNMEDASGATALSIALQNYETTKDEKQKYYRVIKLQLKCPKTVIPQGSFESKGDPFDGHEDFSKFNEIRSVSGELKQSCCLQVKQTLLESSWVGDFRAIRGLLTCPDPEKNVNTVDTKQRTLTYIASMMGHLEAVQVLLQNPDMDVNIGKRIDGGTPFSIASEKSHFEVMQALIVKNTSDLNKGWCRDKWARPCAVKEAFVQTTTMPATIIPTSGK